MTDLLAQHSTAQNKRSFLALPWMECKYQCLLARRQGTAEPLRDQQVPPLHAVILPGRGPNVLWALDPLVAVMPETLHAMRQTLQPTAGQTGKVHQADPPVPKVKRVKWLLHHKRPDASPMQVAMKWPPSVLTVHDRPGLLSIILLRSRSLHLQILDEGVWRRSWVSRSLHGSQIQSPPNWRSKSQQLSDWEAGHALSQGFLGALSAANMAATVAGDGSPGLRWKRFGAAAWQLWA